MIDGACPVCGCDATHASHSLVRLVIDDEIDRALDAGLLQSEPCARCAPSCVAALVDARDRRRTALDARERFRAREQRLAERTARRDAARRGRVTAGPVALPVAAAAALQRALAKAKGG